VRDSDAAATMVRRGRIARNQPQDPVVAEVG
jgi:hypothetical protein